MPLKLIVLISAFVLLAAPVTAGAYTNKGRSPEGVEEAEQRSKEAAEQQARENTERKEHEAKAAEERKTAEERPQREAAERKHQEETREATERTEKEAAEEAQEKAKGAASRCVVPTLEGDSLASARRALHRAHCKLGRVTVPRGGHGTLVVTAQSLRRGAKRPGGTAVAVTLGPARRSRG